MRTLIIGVVICLAQMAMASPLVLIGVDGMTFDVLDPMVAQGKMPNMARLLRSGARSPLISERPMRSPALWTTIATGQQRSQHGIYDFVTGSAYWPKAIRSSKQHLVTSDMRRSKALWQLGVGPSLVVGWLNTWPAETIDGVMLAPYVALGKKRQTSIKGRIYEDAPQQSFPSKLFAQLQPLVMSTKKVPKRILDRLIQRSPVDTSATLYDAIPLLRRYEYTVRWSVASGETNVAVIEHQLKKRTFNLVMTYFDGTDTLAHRFWLMRQPVEEIASRLRAHGLNPLLAPKLKRRYGQTLGGYYELVDAWIGRIQKAVGDDATLIIVSDHGWGSLPPGSRAPHDHVPFDGQHRLKGVFIAGGAGIAKGRFESSQMGLYDIAPTVLYLVGAKVPKNLPGRIVTELIDPVFLAQYPIVRGPKTQAAKQKRKIVTTPKTMAPHDEQELERLRSLGYVQ